MDPIKKFIELSYLFADALAMCQTLLQGARKCSLIYARNSYNTSTLINTGTRSKYTPHMFAIPNSDKNLAQNYNSCYLSRYVINSTTKYVFAQRHATNKKSMYKHHQNIF